MTVAFKTGKYIGLCNLLYRTAYADMNATVSIS